MAATAVVAVTAAASVTPAVSQGGYYGQRATQDRDYSRMQAATNRAFKAQKVTIKKKRKKRRHGR